jgi:hypothetical protein
MGNKDSFLMPCCDYSLPSSRGGIEDFGLSSTGPIKAFRKKCSIATSETISINPIVLGSNRSSVTEFLVNRCDSLTETFAKTPDKDQFYSVPCSPGRHTSIDIYRRRGCDPGKNIVKEVRSKSVVSSPQQSIGPEFSNKLKEEMINFKFCEKRSKRKKESGVYKSTQYETNLYKALR